MKKWVSRLAAMMAAMCPVVAFSAFYDPAFYGQEVQVNVPDYQPTRIPGEYIDRRTGLLAWQEEEFVVSTPTGWKLPIIRSYGNGVNGPKHFGNWELELPRIIINTSPAADVVADYTSETICQNPAPRPFYGYVDEVHHGGTLASAYAAPMRLFIPGEETQTLVRKLSGLPGFPDDAVWVTSNNWFAKCLTDSEGFEVYAPDGRIYRMDLVGRNPGYWVNGGGGKGHISVHATSAKNAFGEMFLFDYDVIVTEAVEVQWEFSARRWLYLKDNIMLPSKPFLLGVRFGREGDAQRDFVKVVRAWYEGSNDSWKYPVISELWFTEHASYDGTFSSSLTGLLGVYEPDRRISYRYHELGPQMYCAFIEEPEWATKCENREHFMRGALVTAEYPDETQTYYMYEGPILGTTSDGVTTGAAYTALSGMMRRNGLSVDYTYQKIDSSVSETSGRSWIPAIAKRTVDYEVFVPGVHSPPYETRYEFSREPEGTRSHRFRGEREDVRYYSLDVAGNFGLLEREQLLAEGVVVGDKSHTYGDYKQYGESHPVTEGDEYMLRNYLRTGTSDGIFSSAYTYEDLYGLLETVTEQGVDVSMPVSRVKVYSYQHPHLDYGKSFVIGLVQQEMVGGYEMSYTEYNWQGLPVYERKKGAEQSFTYFVEPEYYEPALGASNWTSHGPDVGDVLSPTSGFPARVDWTNQTAQSLRFLGLKAGRPEARLWPDGSDAFTLMTTQGRVIQERARDGIETSYWYLWDGRLSGVSYSGGYAGRPGDAATATFVEIYWDPWARDLWQRIGDRDWMQQFDPFGNLVYSQIHSATERSGEHRFWEYDRYGNRVFESVPDASFLNPEGIRFSYDFRDRLEFEDYGDGYFRSICYSDSIHCTAGPGALSRRETDTTGVSVSYTLQGFTRDGTHVPREYKEDISDDGSYTDYRMVVVTYDDLLQPLTVTRDWASEQTYDYDLYGRLSHFDAGRFAYSQNYFDSGEMRTRSWADGRTEAYEYTGSGLLQKLSINGEPVLENTYDAYGRLTDEWNLKDDVSVSYEFGAYGKIVSERLGVAGETYAFGYEYSTFGDVAAVTYPSGKRYEWLFDSLGNSVGIDGVVEATSLSRRGGPQQLVFANGMTGDYWYDEQGRPAHAAAYRPDGRLLYGRDVYFYGDAFPDRSLDRVTGEETFYQHDLIGRLSRVDHGPSRTSYHYDYEDNIQIVDVGGWLGKRYEYAWPEVLPEKLTTSDNYYPIEHDARGNVSRLGGWALAFDELGRLKRLSDYSSWGEPSDQGISYRYTSRGQLASASDAYVGEMHYVFSSVLGRTLYMKDERTGISTDHLYLQDHLVAMIDEIPDADTDGDGVKDALELEIPGRDPTLVEAPVLDRDGDRVTDAEEIQSGLLLTSNDSDEDGISDGDELANGLDPTSGDADADADFDGLSNIAEVEAGLDPHSADTDNDGAGDAEEVARGTLGNASPESPLFVSSDVQDNWVRDVLVSAHGDYLYAILQTELVVYRRDPVAGTLTEVHRYADSAAYYGSELYEHPTRPLLFARKKGRLTVLRQDQAEGGLAVAQIIDEDLHDLAFSPDGSLVYAAAPAVQAIRVFAVDAVDRLELRQGVDLSANGLTPYSLAVGETALFVLVEPNQVVALQRDSSSGAVNATVLASWSSRAISPSGDVVHAEESGSLLVTTGSSFHVLGWTSTSGNEALTRISGGSGGQGLALSADNRLLMSIQGWADRLYVYAVDPDGAVTLSSETQNGDTDALGALVERMDKPEDVSLSPDGRHLYIASANSRSVTHFRFDRFVDLDNDGVNDAGDADADGDGVSNEFDAFPYDPAETIDTDGDGHGDNADAFPADASEFRDTDGDGTGDNSDLDADGDSVDDAWERQHGLDPSNALDADLDQDEDGLTSQQEYLHGTNPNAPDTDGDGGLDGDEIAKGTDPVQLDENLDSDGDGCSNRWELEYGFNIYDAGVQSPSATTDQDGDGLDDLAECHANSNPTLGDSDGDGAGDADETQRGTLPDVSEQTPIFVGSYAQDTWVHDVLVLTGEEYVAAVVQTELRVFRRDRVTGALHEVHRYPDYEAFYGSELYQFPGFRQVYARKKGRVTVMRLDPRTGELAIIQVLHEDVADLALGVIGLHVYAAQPEDQSILVLVPNEVGQLVPQRRLDVSGLGLKPYAVAAGHDALFVLGEPDKVVALPLHVETGEIEARVLASWTNRWISPSGRLVHEPSRQTLYVSRGGSQTFDILDWDGSSGAESLSRSGGGTGADGLSFYRQRDQLVGLSNSADALYVYRRESDGTLTQTDVLRNGGSDALGATVEGMDAPKSLSMPWDGRHLYVASTSSKSIDHFRFDRFIDRDGDGVDDLSDTDVDGDGVEDTSDAAPYDADETLDTDGDGYGDSHADAFPSDASEFRDTDGDGVGNNADVDADGDGMNDEWERKYGLDPLDASDAGYDLDHDGVTNLEEFLLGSEPDA